jgi:alpha-tubulin suppressor-like RCC1 family protein
MTLPVNKLVEKINAKTACESIPELDLLQTQIAANSISQFPSSYISQSAYSNKGRLLFSNGTGKCCYCTTANINDWTTDFESRQNSVLYTWGVNTYGQLGSGNTTNRARPDIPLTLNRNWCKITTGSFHTLALNKDGTLWAWGASNAGQLGDDTNVTKCSPVSVVGGFTDWCQVSAGFQHTAAVRTNGTLWTWGDGGQGRLGNNDTVNQSSPVSVIGGFTDWCQVSAGGSHTAAVRTNGTLWAWGYNGQGRLGDSTDSVFRCSPVTVVGGFTDWCQVSAGVCHTAALRTNGTLYTWGAGANGRLGDNTTTNKSSPVSVAGTSAGLTWCHVSAGDGHTVATKGYTGTFASLGEIYRHKSWSWGRNNFGQLGNCSTIDRSSPVSVVSFTRFCRVEAGHSHSIAFTFDRNPAEMYAWGLNNCGQFGNGTFTNRSCPVGVCEMQWSDVAAGANTSAGIVTWRTGFNG